jgi:DNA invertase Pin-like site-specific DNA recombinase
LVALPERKPAVHGYARASTRRQEASPETQKEQMIAYCRFNELGDDITFYVDPHTSGKIRWDERAGGRALFGRLRPGDHVILPKLDRAFRRLADCAATLEQFERMQIKLHVCNLMGGAIDLSSPMGRFMIHILAAFAELERSFISERTKEGLAHRKKARVRHNCYPGYGFRWKKARVDGKTVKILEVDEEERHVMKSILQWRIQDNPWSWDEIRNHLVYNLKLVTKEGRVWSKMRVRRACKAELLLQLQEQRGQR